MGTDQILDGLARGDTAALARAISLVENQRDGYERVLAHVHARVGRRGTRRIGLTGPPGAGKSTLAERLVQHYRSQGLTGAGSSAPWPRGARRGASPRPLRKWRTSSTPSGSTGS